MVNLSIGERDQECEGTYGPEIKANIRALGETPAYYVLKPLMCSQENENTIVKIGKSSFPKKRMTDYESAYNERFKILHFRTFQKLQGKTFDGRTSFAERYEEAVKKELKSLGIKPLHGSEYFAATDLPKIWEAMGNVNNALKAKHEDYVDNKKSVRAVQNGGEVEAILERKTEDRIVQYKVKFKNNSAPKWVPRSWLVVNAKPLLVAHEKKSKEDAEAIRKAAVQASQQPSSSKRR
jgi:hypothetical protein